MKKPKKVIFINRDGALIKKVKPSDSVDKLEFIPGVIFNLAKIVSQGDYKLAMLVNTTELNRWRDEEYAFSDAHYKMIEILKNESIQFSDILIDDSFSKENLLFQKYLSAEYDLSSSYVIGNQVSDVDLAINLNAKSVYFSDDANEKADLVSNSWQKIFKSLHWSDRIAEVSRKTNETDIRIKINLDGKGSSAIKTGIGFFDHMLELFSRHSMCDLEIVADGDLHVDSHHTIEDTAIVLGQVIAKALGNKKGIERYGFLLPMDESVAEVAIDFSGRPAIVWKAEFKREKVGEMPTEMFYHFFKSFSDSVPCNLYIRSEGENEHHKIEGIFKAVARSVKMAVKRDESSNQVPSTKGVL
jgi:imidazoleglycerol-phosphate dehydratase/histidinol-phosphatase